MSLVLLWVVLQAAEPSSRIGLATVDCDEQLAVRLRSELALDGFEPERVEAEAGRLDGEVARILVRCSREERRALARIDDYLTEKAVERTLPLENGGARGVAAVALHIVELLRASLAEARFAASVVELPPPAKRLVEETLSSPPLWHFDSSDWRCWRPRACRARSRRCRSPPLDASGRSRWARRPWLRFVRSGCRVPAARAMWAWWWPGGS